MPSFKTLTPAEISEMSARRPRMEELMEYLAYLSTLKKGDWGTVEITPDESKRVIKRRTSVAARNQGKEIKWRRSTTPEKLVFEVIS